MELEVVCSECGISIGHLSVELKRQVQKLILQCEGCGTMNNYTHAARKIDELKEYDPSQLTLDAQKEDRDLSEPQVKKSRKKKVEAD